MWVEFNEFQSRSSTSASAKRQKQNINYKIIINLKHLQFFILQSCINWNSLYIDTICTCMIIWSVIQNARSQLLFSSFFVFLKILFLFLAMTRLQIQSSSVFLPNSIVLYNIILYNIIRKRRVVVELKNNTRSWRYSWSFEWNEVKMFYVYFVIENMRQTKWITFYIVSNTTYIFYTKTTNVIIYI